MKTLSLLVVAAALAACNKPATQADLGTPPPPETAAVAPATPAPVIAAAAEPAPVAEAKPPADPLAPDGVFYLLAQTSITTDDGIFGLKPGTRLQQTGEGEYKDQEGRTVKLGAEKVTNNLRLAANAARYDAAAQAGIQRSIAQANVAARSDTNVPLATAPEPASAVASARPPGSRGIAKAPTPDPRALGAVHDRQKDNGFTDKDGHKHWTDVRGKMHVD